MRVIIDAQRRTVLETVIWPASRNHLVSACEQQRWGLENDNRLESVIAKKRITRARHCHTVGGPLAIETPERVAHAAEAETDTAAILSCN